MRYYIDTEFIEAGPHVPIKLISLGIVSEDGREFYVENNDVSHEEIARSPWLKENVLPHLIGYEYAIAHAAIGPAVLRFLGTDARPEFWGYFADYDWVLFAQLFGTMVQLPPHFPHMCLDIRQEMKRLNVSKPTISNEGSLHNALSDARWAKKLHEYVRANGGF